MTRQPFSQQTRGAPPPPVMPAATATTAAGAGQHAQSAPAAARPDAPPRGERPRRNGGMRAWLFGFAGFFLGVVFWHAVGFWSFVSEAVLSGPRQQIAREAPAVKPRIETGSITTGSIHTPPASDARMPPQRNMMSPVRPTPFDRTPSATATGFADRDTAARNDLPTGTLSCEDLALAGATQADLAASGCASRAGEPPAAALAADAEPAAAVEGAARGDGAMAPPLPSRIGTWSTAVQPTD